MHEEMMKNEKTLSKQMTSHITHISMDLSSRYLKRNDEDPPRRFKFIDDPVDEPVKKKRSGESFL